MSSIKEPLSKYFNVERLPYAGFFDGVENTWEALAKIKGYLEEYGRYEIECQVPDGAWITGSDRIAIGRGSVIEAGATIVGPALIGKKCTIRQGAYIRGNVIVGDGCVIGHATEVKHSIFLDGAKAAHFAYVGDSVLGADVNLGAGTKLANFKVDTGVRHVSICSGDDVIETGLRKLGAILGDDVELGCNSVTMPGTFVGPGTLAYPCTVLRGIIPGNSIVKLRQEMEITPRSRD